MIVNKIYNENCQETMERMPFDFLDITITSPPYNVDLGNNKYNKDKYDIHNDAMPYKDYMRWMYDTFLHVYVKTKVGGRCVINIGDGRNGSVPTHADFIHMMQNEIGWIPMTTIIWDKKNVSNRTSWGSFCSPSSPSFPKPFEYILVFAKVNKKLQDKGETDLTNEEFIKWSYGLWEFPGEKKKNTSHPAAFPIELPTRCMKMLSWKGAIVYDPFAGAGTTAMACVKNGRNFIGSEISADYVKIAEERITTSQGL